MPQPQKKVKTAIKGLVVWYLKHNGPVVHKGGVAQTVLMDAIKNSAPELPDFTKQAFSLIIKELEADGYISRDASGNRIYSISVLHTGKIPDPYATERSFAGRTRPPKEPSLNQVLRDARKLPVPQRLEVASKVIDSCTGEVEETFVRVSRLRAALGDRP